MKTYIGKINNLKDNQVFVFGSNPLKIQGAGAAKQAVKNGWCLSSELMNNHISRSGKAWGLVTVTGPGKKRSKTPEQIKSNIQILFQYAKIFNDKEFLIAYTGTDSYNLNGYSNKELAEMFSAFEIPENIIFEEEFSTLLKVRNIQILSCSLIAEASFSPTLVAITIENEKIRVYDIKVSNNTVQNFRGFSIDDANNFIKSGIFNAKPEEEYTPEEAIKKYPNLKQSILPLLRDKKIDELL